MKTPPTIRTYGGTFRGKCPRESVEQSSFFNRIRQEYPETWGLLAVHVRNEGMLVNGQFTAITKHRMEGMQKGCADILIPGSPTFVCEMKRQDPTKSILDDEQLKYLEAAQTAGAFACVAFGAAAAWDAFEEWLSLQNRFTDDLK